MRMLKRLTFLILLTASAIYLIALAALYLLQRDFLYVGGGEYQPPAESGLTGFAEMPLPTPDGETLLAWHHPAEPGERTLLYLQGNADTLPNRVPVFTAFRDAGLGVLAISYRGFYGSTGSPTQDGLITDAIAAHDWLTERGDSVVLYGQSLGSGVATHLAVERPVDALILEVPFTAAVDVATGQYPIFPVSWLMQDQWRSRDIIGQINVPLLIVGAGRDEVIPVEQSRALFELANEPKAYAVLPNSRHSEAWDNGIWNEIEPFLETLD